MNRPESIDHLMKAAKVDQSRLLQQAICYHRPSNWSFSISWGYSINIYENILPRSLLWRPIETFRPWKHTRPPLYMFNTRWFSNNPCEAPHAFFLDSVDQQYPRGDQIATTYIRRSPRGLPACSLAGNHSADVITKIHVFSPATTRMEVSAFIFYPTRSIYKASNICSYLSCLQLENYCLLFCELFIHQSIRKDQKDYTFTSPIVEY